LFCFLHLLHLGYLTPECQSLEGVEGTLMISWPPSHCHLDVYKHCQLQVPQGNVWPP
jgi:hypothetical protein